MTHLPDLRYLSGFTGSSAALAITRRGACLFTDGRYKTQAAEEVARYLKSLGIAVDYEGRISKVRAILADRLGADPQNSDRFGNAQFAHAMLYGEEGERGVMSWQILRLDLPTHPQVRVTFHWRSNTTKQMAEKLIAAYENLAR